MKQVRITLTFSSVTDALGLKGIKDWIKNKWGKYTEGIRDEAGNITFSSVTDALGLRRFEKLG